MEDYIVTTGRLRVRLLAPNAWEAAEEAVRCWGWDGASSEGDHRGDAIDQELRVCRAGQRARVQRFAATRVMARLHGQALTTAWQQRLRDITASN